MTLEQTQRRRQAVSTIHDIVGAMRAIAAGRIQGAQRALDAARRYDVVVRRGIASLAAKSEVRVLPSIEGRPSLLVVLTSEQPLCGTFNQDVLAHAERRWQELRQLGTLDLVVVGQRGARGSCPGAGILPDAYHPAATSLPGLRDLVNRLARTIDNRYAAGQLGTLRVIYNRYQSVSQQVPTEEKVLPLDLNSIQAPMPPGFDCHRYLPVPLLLAGLISEYTFISLYRMAAESYASEQASRLIAMDGATRNTDKMLNGLLDLERRERQGQITQEVLELIGARLGSQ